MGIHYSTDVTLALMISSPTVTVAIILIIMAALRHPMANLELFMLSAKIGINKDRFDCSFPVFGHAIRTCTHVRMQIVLASPWTFDSIKTTCLVIRFVGLWPEDSSTEL